MVYGDVLFSMVMKKVKNIIPSIHGGTHLKMCLKLKVQFSESRLCTVWNENKYTSM